MNKILYPGTFDPPTNGHLDMITRAAKLADEVIIGIIKNPSKNPMFSVEERKEMLEISIGNLANVRVDSFEGLLVEYVKKNNISAVLRGLRATMDFEYEIQMAQVNSKLYSEMETIFLMADAGNSYISSSMVREIFSLGGDIKSLVPEKVYEYMKEKFLAAR